ALRPASAPAIAPTEALVGEDEGLRIRDQLVKMDDALSGPLTVRQVLRADLDGDDRDDAVYVVAMPGLEAVLMAATTTPARLRILQFSDTERYELLAAVDLDPARPGRQLVLRTTSAGAAELQVVRATGEVVGDLRCLTSP